MIQRIQSIFLVLAITCSSLLFAEPVFTWRSNADNTIYQSGITDTTLTTDNGEARLFLNLPTLLLNALIILFSLYVLFGFKNRPRQAKSCHLLLISQLLLISLVFYNWDKVNSLAGAGYEWNFTAAIVFLIAPVLLFPAARHFIKKDEALVRSADRLR